MTPTTTSTPDQLRAVKAVQRTLPVQYATGRDTGRAAADREAHWLIQTIMADDESDRIHALVMQAREAREWIERLVTCYGPMEALP
jgi:hypothetical protein